MSPFALRSVRPVALALVLSLAACRTQSDPAADSTPAGSEDAGAQNAAAAVLDAGVPEDPKPARLEVKITAVSDERTVELSSAEPTEDVPPASRFEVVLPRLPDVRVRLFDEADKMVPSTDSLVLSGDTARYVLTPDEPLVTGTRYALLVDGQRGELPTDGNGTTFSDVRVELKTSGEKPKPAPAKPSRSRKRRR